MRNPTSLSLSSSMTLQIENGESGAESIVCCCLFSAEVAATISE
jgi:hypothetical protein